MSIDAYYVNPSTTENVDFIPVKVEKGRKFRGKGFIVAVTCSSSSVGWRHNGYGWERNTYESETAKIWVPELKRFQYANNAYVIEDKTVSKEDAAKAFDEYAECMVQSTIEWCRTKSPNADEIEIRQFARNVLRKNHPELNAMVDAALPDRRNLNEEIAKTIAWAMTLRTQPCHMYGRFCPGGKKLSNERYVEIARKALVKRGISTKDGFDAAFADECSKAGLDKFETSI